MVTSARNTVASTGCCTVPSSREDLFLANTSLTCLFHAISGAAGANAAAQGVRRDFDRRTLPGTSLVGRAGPCACVRFARAS